MQYPPGVVHRGASPLGARAALTALTLVLVAPAACRAVIGYSAITLTEGTDAASPQIDAGITPDAPSGHDVLDAAHAIDAGVDASCPSASPSVLFKTPLAIDNVFLNGSYVYAQTIAVPEMLPLDASGSYPNGALACPKVGCGGTAGTILAPTSDGGFLLSATANDAGLYYARQLTTGDAAPGVLESADLDGGALQVLLVHAGYPEWLAADAESLYWADNADDFVDSEAPWYVRSALLGTEPVVPTTFIQGFPNGTVAAVFLDSKNLYVLAGDATGDPALFLCPRLTLDGGGGCAASAEPIVSNVAVDGYGYPIDSFTADGVSVFQAGSVTGNITRIDLTTHEPTLLASGQASPSFILVAGDRVYWASESGLIFQMPKDGSRAPVPFVCGLSAVTALVADGSRLFFSASIAGGYEVASAPLPP